VRRTLSRVGDGVGFATSVMRSRFWPVLGLVRGVTAGLATLTQRRPDSSGKSQVKNAKNATNATNATNKEDIEAERRFAYEGGMSYARS